MDPSGGVLQISSDMDDQMGAKIETQKNPMPILQAIKISSTTTRSGHAGTITNLQIVSNTQNNSYLNQAPQKILAKIFLPKQNPEIKNFKPKKIL